MAEETREKREAGDKRVEVHADQCKGCGVCVAFCPRQCFAMTETVNALGYRVVEFRQKDCTACGICYFVCPEFGAITVFG